MASKPYGFLLIRKTSGRTLPCNRVCGLWRPTVKNKGIKTFGSMPANTSVPLTTTKTSDVGSDVLQNPTSKWEAWEVDIEKVIYGCRFLAFFAVWGSLVGSLLCFIKGSTYVVASFMDYYVKQGKVIMTLVEAIDIYLLGTVMMVFGMGLYELFVSNLDSATSPHSRSNLFGIFPLKERPPWLEIKSVNALKTKLGHVIVMILLVGLLEKSRIVEIITTGDLLCFSASILLSSGSLYLLSRLNK